MMCGHHLRYFAVLFVLFFVGCGSSNDFVVTAPGLAEVVTAKPATVRLRSVLAQTVVQSEVVSFRGAGYNEAGELLHGPVTLGKAEVVEWTEVPVAVTRFVVTAVREALKVVPVAPAEMSI